MNKISRIIVMLMVVIIKGNYVKIKKLRVYNNSYNLK